MRDPLRLLSRPMLSQAAVSFSFTGFCSAAHLLHFIADLLYLMLPWKVRFSDKRGLVPVLFSDLQLELLCDIFNYDSYNIMGSFQFLKLLKVSFNIR